MILGITLQLEHITRTYSLHVDIAYDPATNLFTATCLDNLNITVAVGVDAVLEQAVYVACRRAVVQRQAR